jgi:hypothetical protein
MFLRTSLFWVITRRKPEITPTSVYIHDRYLNLMFTLEDRRNLNTFYSVLPDLQKNINLLNVPRLRPFLLLGETYRWKRACGIGEVTGMWESQSIQRKSCHVATLFTINLTWTELERTRDSTAVDRQPRHRDIGLKATWKYQLLRHSNHTTSWRKHTSYYFLRKKIDVPHVRRLL